MNINIIGIIDEDFVNYRVPSMTIEFPYCDFKCNKEAGRIVCQNYNSTECSIISVSVRELCQRYINNPITKAIVCQGFEPFESFKELVALVAMLRNTFNCQDDIVIYTGFYNEEIENEIMQLSKYPNIIVKYGRYIPNTDSRYDDILGVKLASDNQYAKKIS